MRHLLPRLDGDAFHPFSNRGVLEAHLLSNCGYSNWHLKQKNIGSTFAANLNIHKQNVDSLRTIISLTGFEKMYS